jgi:CRP/FNR family cyclic AMP-dependent transcriptional regulator
MNYVDVLKRTDLFCELTPPQLERVATICQERTGRASEIIFEENTAGKELYIVVKGEVEILLDPGLVSGPRSPGASSPVPIASLHQGQAFGEVALIDQGLRSASARCAVNNTLLLVILSDKLIELCDADTDLGYHVMRNVAAELAFKIRSSDLAIREQLLWRPRHAV